MDVVELFHSMRQNNEGIGRYFCRFCGIVLHIHAYLKGTENISGGKQSTTTCM